MNIEVTYENLDSGSSMKRKFTIDNYKKEKITILLEDLAKEIIQMEEYKEAKKDGDR